MPGSKNIFQHYFFPFFTRQRHAISYDPAHELRILMEQDASFAPNPHAPKH